LPKPEEKKKPAVEEKKQNTNTTKLDMTSKTQDQTDMNELTMSQQFAD